LTQDLRASEAGPEGCKDGMISILILEWFVILSRSQSGDDVKHGGIFVLKLKTDVHRRNQASGLVSTMSISLNLNFLVSSLFLSSENGLKRILKSLDLPRFELNYNNLSFSVCALFIFEILFKSFPRSLVILPTISQYFLKSCPLDRRSDWFLTCINPCILLYSSCLRGR